MSADTSELRQFAHHLETAVAACEGDLSEVVEKGAIALERSARRHLASHSRRRYLKHYPRSFSHDMITPLEAEVGPDASKPQGGMGRGTEFGSVHTPPMPHWNPAADEIERTFGNDAGGILSKAMR